jgi:hypothetical protein
MSWQMFADGLPIPEELIALLQTGRWPGTAQEANGQNLRPGLIRPERVRTIADDESLVFLYPPPFSTVESLRRSGERFWDEAYAAPQEISFAHSVPIGDFGLGSDAPIMLDYRADPSSPAVIRLRWSPNGRQANRWVPVADSFARFAELLDLWNIERKGRGERDTG